MPDDATGPIEYLASLTDRDRLRVCYWHRNGVPVEIMAQLECEFGGQWVPARRVDSHVELHEHTAPWDPEVDRRVPVRGMSMKDALTRVIDDIKTNRRRYRMLCAVGLGWRD